MFCGYAGFVGTNNSPYRHNLSQYMSTELILVVVMFFEVHWNGSLKFCATALSKLRGSGEVKQNSHQEGLLLNPKD